MTSCAGLISWSRRRSRVTRAFRKPWPSKRAAPHRRSTSLRNEGGTSSIIALSRRINDANGRFQGVAVAWVNLDYFRRFYRTIDLGAGSEVVLFRPDGELLARYPSPGDEISRAP